MTTGSGLHPRRFMTGLGCHGDDDDDARGGFVVGIVV